MKCTLADVADITMGQSPKSEYYNSKGDGIPFLQGNRTFGRRYPIFDTYTTFTTKIAKAGDVIMSVRAPVGDLNIAPVDMCLGRGVCGIKMKNGNNDFLFYLLKYYMPQLINKETGTVFGSVNKNDINELEIDIPKEETVQKKIARYLSLIDDKIEENEKINKNLEQQVCAIYQSWFEDFKLTNGICPECWSYKELSTIANISSGKRPPIKSNICNQETPISIVGASSIIGFTSKSNNIDRILVTGRVGTHGIIQRLNTPCWASDNTLVIKSSYYEFTNQILNRIDFSTMNRGSTQPLITQGDIKKIVILVPDENTLKKFEEFAGSLMDQWERNNNENIKLISLRDTLLPKLISGEIDVSDIDL